MASLTRAETIEQYRKIISEAHELDAQQGGTAYVDAAERMLCQRDLFYLLSFVLGRVDIRASDWLFARCREVQQEPNGYLDLWSREHFKSSIISFGLTIQDVLNNPEITVCIFSHTKPIARAFLRQIKYEFEKNERLKTLFPDILYADPKTEAPAMGNSWSEEKGITVKRKGNPKESTLEAHGLVDGQPTSRHFDLLVYDDIVTLESVTSPEMIQKTTDALSISYNLGAEGGARRFIGTRYHYGDTYNDILQRGTAVPRIYPATDDGTMTGTPVLWSKETFEGKVRDMGTAVAACQLLQNPLAAGSFGFDLRWLQYWPAKKWEGMNLYLLCDPAHSKKKRSDYTVFAVVGLASDQNYYLIDIVRDRLSLGERCATLMYLHRRYRPLKTGYERYGMQADIEHIRAEQKRDNYRFAIEELGGIVAKKERIGQLVPLFETGRVFLPQNKVYLNSEGKTVDLIQDFTTEEYVNWPVSKYDDMLDCMARIRDPKLDAKFPAPFASIESIEPEPEEVY